VDDVGVIEKEILENFCHRWNPGPDGSEDFIIPTAEELLEAKQTIIRILQGYEIRRIQGGIDTPVAHADESDADAEDSEEMER